MTDKNEVAPGQNNDIKNWREVKSPVLIVVVPPPSKSAEIRWIIYV
jgi:ABC-type sulfate transport system substrate-binding protein